MQLLVLQTCIFPVSCRIALAYDSCNEVFDNVSGACSKWVYCGSQKPFQKAPVSELREKQESTGFK